MKPEWSSHEPLLMLDAVSKEYNLRPVLNGVSLKLYRGETYALTAPNGSGKTTLLQVMCGLSRPSRGHVHFLGRPLSPAARRQIGVVLQQGFLYGDLTAEENLSLYARLYGCSKPREKAQEWVERAGLNGAFDLKVKDYSKGMKQRLSLARALIHEPDLLLLDEPFDGLDPQGTARFRSHLTEAVSARNVTVFLVTHHEDEATAAQRRLTLVHGRVVAVQ